MSLYISSREDLQNPYFAPYLAQSHANQPRTLVITAEYDPLRDEGEAYGEKLRQAGNTVYTYRMKDALHGFFTLPAKIAPVKTALYCISRFLSSDRTQNTSGIQQRQDKNHISDNKDITCSPDSD